MKKKELRKKILSERDAMSADQHFFKDALIHEHLLKSKRYRAAENIFCYVNFRSEVATLSLLAFMLDCGKNVSVPFIREEESEMEAREIQSVSELKTGLYNIYTPGKTSPRIMPEEIDLALVPGAVFDRKGNRIGYGGGYYDRFLSRINPRGYSMALAYELQVISSIPAPDAWDVPVNAVITENEILEF